MTTEDERERNEEVQKMVPLRQEILAISMHDPLIHSVLQYWRIGDITWEQAMQMLVIEQYRVNQEHQAQTIMALQNRKPGEYRI